MTEIRITNPKLAFRLPVNVPVCVRNPGPIAEVAIRNAAPIRTLRLFLFFFSIFSLPFLIRLIVRLYRNKTISAIIFIFMQF